MTRHCYRLRYRRRDNPNRTYHATVVASSADEARAYLALKDPEYGSTVASPRRGAEVVTPEPACWSCKRTEPIAVGTYTRVDFGGRIGVVLLCDDCGARAS